MCMSEKISSELSSMNTKKGILHKPSHCKLMKVSTCIYIGLRRNTGIYLHILACRDYSMLKIFSLF